MYTKEMADAFHAIKPPKNFHVDLIDYDEWITVKADTKEFARLLDSERVDAANYMINVKKALEENGAIVMLVREVIQD